MKSMLCEIMFTIDTPFKLLVSPDFGLANKIYISYCKVEEIWSGHSTAILPRV